MSAYNRWWLRGCLFVAGGLWGITPALSRIATDAGGHPLGLTLWQGLGGGAAMLVVVWLRGSRLPLAPKRLLFYGVCGLTGTAIPTTLLFASAQHLPVGIIALAISAVPLLTYAIAIMVRVDALSPVRVAGIMLGLLAVCLLVLPEQGLPATASVGWLLAAMVIPLLYASENNIIAVFRPADVDAWTLVCGMLLCGGLAILPVTYLSDSFTPINYPFRVIEWTTLALIAVNIICYATFIYVIRLAGPVFASQANYITMLVGVLVGIIVFSEQHSAWVWAAIVLMILGMALVEERPKPEREQRHA